ncbi:tRNA (N(6)-L-threonylcarbamoyladenosine(37)-C(2))-methylthiotransferase MtaB [Clostridium sp. M62/1]|uniref:tRNA (N(6)-L-threonylcarbamoyladenosine(37)-C(2))- methylthiotransferase MtaB n=1 Tax=Clostridium sp. M62/1 TaxID=411486 RepID=UPI0001C34C9A|nr:tRNA (N(6)-L-threonylcarbamoyladenosine(37)-C(2))-methylthiotransferase MtaB [Clostridium sp. M62/1]UEB80149.1 tRNA (N(6)-L-threonylcarbamoyladenosine(37)-C(2))-methylthiotransferase MtaB [Clostridium sp. M62/1]CBK78302.1 MiaB-like tRNA modifying enzyme [[Clostridium] cf. saccharolyticum K10]
MRKAALHNLGCKVNAYETEAMQQMLEDAGYEIVPFREGADVYVINTCSVTNVADKKSRQMLHRAKKMNPSAVVVAAGCYVQAAGEELKKDEAVDLVIGNNRKKDLVEVLERYFNEHEGTDDIIDIGKTSEYEKLHIRKIADHTRAFIKVQDGCNQFCSYCIIPYTRGRVRSRSMEDVVQEVEALAASGYKEIVLTGIHLSSYGADFKRTAENPEAAADLLSLIVRLDRIPGIERIRLGSLEPRIITDEFAETLAGLKSFCPHFHLSLQSGCNETLKRMNRHYTTEDYEARCEILRRYFHNPAITTDVIVGFPQETEEEFEETRQFLKRIHFYEMHIFKYSRREGTRAAVMEGQVPEPKKAERSDILLALEEQMSLEYRRTFLGKEEEVLLEERISVDGEDYMVGHTRQYVKAVVPYREGLKNVTVRGVMERMVTDEILFLREK